MRDCPLIEDLMPLYVDDAVSPESRVLIEQHLASCPSCRQSLQALQGPGRRALTARADDPPAAEEARFLHRLRRQVGTAIGAGLVLLVAVALIATQVGRWSAQRQAAERIRAEKAYRQEALEALKAASPAPEVLLRRLGVELSTHAARQGGGVAVDFRLTSPQGRFEHFTPIPGGPRMNVSITDPATGSPVKADSVGGSSSWQAGQGEGTYTVGPVPGGPLQVRIDYPVFTGYLKVDEPIRMEFRRPEETGDVLLNQRLTVHGVEFEIERVRFEGSKVRVEYRQLTDPAQVGVHYLALRLSDGLGGGWGGIPMDELPDPRRPFTEFGSANSPSQNWSLSVQYAVLAVPGPRVTVDLK